MLKFFRQYMKYILAVFVALLMVAFLIQPTLSMFAPDPLSQVIGSIGSQELTLGDERIAGTELALLQATSPVLVQLASGIAPQPPRASQWLLMLREARAMGLSASEAEVDQLMATLGLDETRLPQVLERTNASVGRIRGALRSWLIVQAYKELLYATQHRRVSQRLEDYLRGMQFLQFGYLQGAMALIGQAMMGSPRLSQPLLERFLYDHQTTVQTAFAAAATDLYLDQSGEPDEQALQDLFDQYKEALPGQGKPYPLGYRIPQQVQIEYLAIPLARVLQQVTIEEADALSYYDTHLDEFRPPAASTQPSEDDTDNKRLPRPYTEVRQQIIRRLTDQKANQLSQQIAKAAIAIMLEDARPLPEQGGYREVPDDWQPVGLVEVAQQLYKQFDVLPVVRHHEDRWQTQQHLAGLPDISRSRVTGQQRPVGFVEYVFSAKELQKEGDKDRPLASLRLQAQMPSMPVESAGGNRYVFRLAGAKPDRVPASIDEIRQQVVQDANRIAAYERLKQDAATWEARLADQGLNDTAKQWNLTLLSPPAFPKRETGVGGQLQAPSVSGVGRSEAFVDGVFALADRVAQANPDRLGQDLQDRVPATQRVGVVPVDHQMSLYLVRLDAINPMTRSDLDRIAQSSPVGTWINQTLADPQRQDPLSLEAVSQRVGFEALWAQDMPDSETDLENSQP